jgi:IS4 transposase
MTEERVPLGLLQQWVWTRPEERRNGDHATRPIDDKESQKWLRSLEAVGQARQVCEQTHFVSIGDREADVYDLFAMERPEGADFLVRAAQDRLVEAPERRLGDTLAAEPVAATIKIRIGRQDKTVLDREATLSVRWKPVRLRPPKNRRAGSIPLRSIDVWAVWAVEEQPPAGTKPIEWMLVTTVPVRSTADALQIMEWYVCRWGIEIWHKVLKSGCQIEARQLRSADRLTRCLTVFSVIAWHVLYATMLARSIPDMPNTALLSTRTKVL